MYKIETLIALCHITCSSRLNMCFHLLSLNFMLCKVWHLIIQHLFFEAGRPTHGHMVFTKVCINMDLEDIKANITHVDLQLPCLYVTST